METNPEMITIPVKLDEKTFRRFAYFDMFILRKKWIRPVVFFLIMTAFAFAGVSGISMPATVTHALLPFTLTTPSTKFICGDPMKPATKRLPGSSYRCCGVSTC